MLVWIDLDVLWLVWYSLGEMRSKGQRSRLWSGNGWSQHHRLLPLV